MASIAQVSRAMRRLFEEEAAPLARQVGLRQKRMRFHELAYLLVLGWWHRPAAGPSALARFGGTLGLRLSKQDVDCHFTALSAQWLLALLRRGVQVLVCASGVAGEHRARVGGDPQEQHRGGDQRSGSQGNRALRLAGRPVARPASASGPTARIA